MMGLTWGYILMALGVTCMLTAGCLGVAAWADDNNNSANSNDSKLMLGAWSLILSGGAIMVIGLFVMGYFHIPGRTSPQVSSYSTTY